MPRVLYMCATVRVPHECSRPALAILLTVLQDIVLCWSSTSTAATVPKAYRATHTGVAWST